MAKEARFTLPKGMGSIDDLDETALLELADRLLHRDTPGLEGLGEGVARRVVDLRRKAAAECDAGNEDREALAGALLLHARWLLAGGRHEEALAAERESVALARALCEGDDVTAESRIALGCSLRALGATLAEQEDADEALTHLEEAVAVLRALPADGPPEGRIELSTALGGLGQVLEGMERFRDAADAFAESAAILRSADEEQAEALRPVLALALRSLAHTLACEERYEEAIAPARESADIYGLLAAGEPGVYGMDHAMTLGTLGLLHRHRSEPAEAAPLFLAGIDSMVACLAASHDDAVSEEDDELLRSLVQDYAETCEDAGIEVDVAALESLLGGPGEEDADDNGGGGGRIILPR